MIKYLMFGISFISLFLALFWINVLYFVEQKKNIKLKHFPKVTIAIPAYNEEDNIGDTIKSVLNLDYPKNKLEVIVVDDKSGDNTLKVIKTFKGIKIIAREKNSGGSKAKPVNDALKIARGEIFGVVDSDSLVHRNNLKRMLPYFGEKKTGSVITLMKVRDTNNLLRKIQHLEYIFGAFARRLMSKIDTLYITPGVLSLYRTKLIKNLGGFDEDNLAEDLEIAMRLKANHYNIKMESDAITYTNVPETFKALWNQRLRWFRGFLYNTKKYKNLLFSRKHGAMGMFQVPLNYLTILLVVTIFALAVFGTFNFIYNYIMKFIVYRWGIFELIEMPGLKAIITSVDLKLWFPIALAFIFGLFIYHKAHKFAGERWRFPVALLLYITLYPMLRIVHWIVSITKEVTKAEKRW